MVARRSISWRVAKGGRGRASCRLRHAGISGAEVIRAARLTRPDLPAVLMTGYAEADGLGEDPRHVALLKKPFRLHELEATLDSAPSPQARQPASSNVISLARSRRDSL